MLCLMLRSLMIIQLLHHSVYVLKSLYLTTKGMLLFNIYSRESPDMTKVLQNEGKIVSPSARRRRQKSSAEVHQKVLVW